VEKAIVIIGIVHNLAIGIGQALELTGVVVGLAHRLRRGVVIGGHRERICDILSTRIVTATTPPAPGTIAEDLGDLRTNGIGGRRCCTPAWEDHSANTTIVVFIVEVRNVRAILTGTHGCLGRAFTEQTIQGIVTAGILACGCPMGLRVGSCFPLTCILRSGTFAAVVVPCNQLGVAIGGLGLRLDAAYTLGSVLQPLSIVVLTIQKIINSVKGCDQNF
jgi:hypothetical protein